MGRISKTHGAKAAVAVEIAEAADHPVHVPRLALLDRHLLFDHLRLVVAEPLDADLADDFLVQGVACAFAERAASFSPLGQMLAGDPRRIENREHARNRGEAGPVSRRDDGVGAVESGRADRAEVGADDELRVLQSPACSSTGS